MGTRCGQPSGLRVGPMSVWLPAGWRGGRWPGAGCRIHTQSRGGYGRLAEPVSPGTAHGWGLNARRPCCCPQIPPIPFRHFLRGSPRSGSVNPRGGREGLRKDLADPAGLLLTGASPRGPAPHPGL